MKVMVVGGGLAGLSAALELVDGGHEVTLHEARPTLGGAVGTWLTMLGWRIILRDLGSDLHLAQGSGVYFVGQLGKYLPGSLWSVLVQADIASHLKVPRRRTAVAGLLALGLSLLTGVLVGLPAASFLLRRDADAFSWWVRA